VGTYILLDGEQHKNDDIKEQVLGLINLSQSNNLAKVIGLVVASSRNEWSLVKDLA
jgi:hypothetical protein